MAGPISAQIKSIRPVWVTFGRFHGVSHPADGWSIFKKVKGVWVKR